VSPQNILVGSDGVARLLDFGIAKALGRMRTTPSGEIKGKLCYISCEQLHATLVDRRTDVYAASVVLWETLAGHALFDGASESSIVHSVLYDEVLPPSAARVEVPAALDRIVLRGLSRAMDERFASAREMALAIEHEVGLASQSEVSTWLHALAGARMAERAQRLALLQEAQERGDTLQLTAATSTRRIDEGPAALAESDQATGRRLRITPWHVALAVIALTLAGVTWWARPLHMRRGREREPTPGRTYVGSSQPTAAEAPPSPRATEPLPRMAAGGQRAVEAVIPGPQTKLPTRSDAEGQLAVEPVTIPVPETSGVAPVPIAPPSLRSAPADRAASHHSTRARSARSAEPGDDRAKARPNKQCEPFYYVDNQGIRRPKPECL
jgi:hypothetical protein